MGRTVKCRKCGARIDQKTAFKVVVGKVNTYYCNEQEYNEIISARQIKDDTYKCINKIFGYVVTNTAIFKEINAHTKVHIADTVDCKTDGVFTGVKNAVLTRYIVFKLEQIVAVFQFKYIFCLSSVHKFHFVYLRKPYLVLLYFSSASLFLRSTF